MRIAVFGAGGIGGYIGGRLAQTGEEVVLIARGEHLQAIQQRGLRVDSPKGDFVAYPALATDDPNQVGEVDAVILGVKTWHVPEAAQAVHPMVGQATAVVPLQNGVDAPSQLAAVLGAEHVLIGICTVRRLIVGPGHIRHMLDVDPNLQLGEMDNRSSDRVEGLRRVLENAGLSVAVPPAIHAALWEKFMAFAVASGMGAITRETTEVWRTLPETRKMAEVAAYELLAVARARSIAISEKAVEAVMRLLDSVAQGHTTSVVKDIMDGKPSELEATVGVVVRLSQEVGVDTPVNAFIYNSLLPQELNARGRVKHPS